MSAISGVSGSPPPQWQPRINDPTQQQGLEQIRSQFGTQFKDQIQTAAQQAGIDTAKLSEIQNDLKAAFAEAGPNANPRDIAQGVFEKHGVDPNQLRSQFESMAAKFPSLQGLNQNQFFTNQANSTTNSLDQLFAALDSSSEEQERTSSKLLNDLLNAPRGSFIDTAA